MKNIANDLSIIALANGDWAASPINFAEVALDEVTNPKSNNFGNEI